MSLHVVERLADEGLLGQALSLALVQRPHRLSPQDELWRQASSGSNLEQNFLQINDFVHIGPNVVGKKNQLVFKSIIILYLIYVLERLSSEVDSACWWQFKGPRGPPFLAGRA